jgi:hypothetical protein
MSEISTTTDIEVIPRTALVSPEGSLSDIVKNMDAYQGLCKALLDKNDWQEIAGKKFPKRSAWRKLAVAYGVSFEIIDRTMHWNDDGGLKSAEFVVRATAPNGRFADGWGACSVEERNAGRKSNHDIPATAETRAKNRAAADLFGMGEVSAEEVDRNAMYISDDAKLKLTQRINSLEINKREVLRGLWKDSEMPSKDRLNDDQLEVVHTLIDQVESFGGLESEDQEVEEAF